MRPPEVAPRAVIYARISMDRTGEGLGVERQTADCAALAKERGFNVLATLSDNDISAFSGKPRPGYEALLQMIRAGEVDVVIAWHTDRLHRSLRDLENYIDACELHRVSTLTVRSGELDLSTASGRMTARIVGSVARHESEQKGERVRRARKQAAEMGRAHGLLGYGYDANRNVVAAEALVIRQVARRILDGETLYSIAKDLNERGVPTPGAGGWRHQHIARVLAGRGASIGIDDELCALIRDMSDGTASPALAAFLKTRPDLQVTPGVALGPGQVAILLDCAELPAPATTWRSANLAAMIRRGSLAGWRDFNPGARGGGPMVAKGDWTPILEKTTTERLRALLDAPGRKVAGRHPKFLLTGIAECGTCRARLAGVTDNRTGRRRYSCNTIPGTDRCGKLTVTAGAVEKMVTEAVLAVLADAPFRAARKRLRPTDDFNAAVNKMAELEEELAAWRSDLETGLADRATFLLAIDGIQRRRAPLEKIIGAHGPELTSALAGIPVGRKEIDRWWEAATIEQRRRVIKALIECVVIKKTDRPGGNVFDPSRVEPPTWRNS